MATMEELANQVAHATTGKDVRGAIAEGFGQFDQAKGEVFRRVKAGDDSEARDRRAADEKLEQRITKLEKIIFGQNPLEIKDTVPTKAESTAVEINDSLATQIFLE